MTGERYEIKTLQDFTKVPRERRKICLREFRVWLEMGESVGDLMDGLPVTWPTEYVWIDDDEHTISVSIKAGDQKIPVVSGTMRGFGA